MLKIILLVLFSFSAHARVFVWPLQLGLRYERAENQDLGSRTVRGLGVGLSFDVWYGEAIYQGFSTSTSEGNVAIKREYQDVALWGGYTLHTIESWNFLAIAGLGLYKEKVKTTIGVASDSSTSKEKSLFGLCGEVRFSPEDLWVAASAGGRFIWGENFDPNPQPEIYFKLGVSF